MTLPAAFAVRRRPEDYGQHPDGHSGEDVAAGRAAAAQRDYENSMTRAQAMRTISFYLLVLAFGLFQISITAMLTQTIPLMTDAGYSRLFASSMISVILDINESHSLVEKKLGSIKTPFSSKEFFCSVVSALILAFMFALAGKFVHSQQAFGDVGQKRLRQ